MIRADRDHPAHRFPVARGRPLPGRATRSGHEPDLVADYRGRTPALVAHVTVSDLHQPAIHDGAHSGTTVTRTRYPDLGVTPTGSTWATADTGGYVSACRLAGQPYSAVRPVPETVMAYPLLSAGQGSLCSWRTPSPGCRGGSLHSRLGGGSAMGAGAAVERYDGAPPGEDEIAARMRAEGLSPHGWGNAPGDTYGWHEHGYEKVLYCVRGRIVFHTTGGDVELGPGDKMVLPPHTPHAATVGTQGVRCIEAPRQR